MKSFLPLPRTLPAAAFLAGLFLLLGLLAACPVPGRGLPCLLLQATLACTAFLAAATLLLVRR